MKTYPHITYTQVEAEVRRLAEENPTFNYMEQEGADVSCSSSYLGASIPGDMDWGNPEEYVSQYEGQGCIVGQALTNLGVGAKDLVHCEHHHAEAAVEMLGLTEDGDGLARFLTSVQNHQDVGEPWGMAVKQADEAVANGKGWAL